MFLLLGWLSFAEVVDFVLLAASADLLLFISAIFNLSASGAERAPSAELAKLLRPRPTIELTPTVRIPASQSSSKMVSSLVMYKAFKKDGTSSLCSCFDVSAVEAVWLLAAYFFDAAFFELSLPCEFLIGDAVMCVYACTVYWNALISCILRIYLLH